MDPAAILGRVLDRPRVALVMAVLDTYGRAAGGLLANGLAFAALFAAIPTTLLVLGLTGFFVSDPAIRDKVTAALVAAFPPLADLIDAALDALSTSAAVTSFLGLIGVIWTVSQFYVTLDVAFARIFSGEPERDMVRRTARGFVVIVLIAALILAFIVVASVRAPSTRWHASRSRWPRRCRGCWGPCGCSWRRRSRSSRVVYRILPPKAPAVAVAGVPAVVVGIAIVVLSQVFMFLVPRLVGVAALAGSLASAFIALAWLSFTFQALLYGAAWVRVRDGWRPSGVSRPGASRSAGRTGRWRTVTARS